MRSATSDFSTLKKSEPDRNSITQRNALSTAKKPRQCQQRRKILNIGPLRLDQIQKEIEEAVAENEHTWELPSRKELEKYDTNKENSQNPPPQLQDSFDINFAALSLNTPAKKQEVVKPERFLTPCIEHKSTGPPKISRALNYQYATPNNKIPSKVQCSVKMQPYIKTPITKLYAAPDQTKNNYDQKLVQSVSPDVSFKKIKVNNIMYVVLDELGKGGSSEVFHCYNADAKAHRAIKVVNLENRVSAVGFINEVKMLKTLQKCKRIIKMFDYEIKEEEKILLVVLEVGGTDLSKILKESALDNCHMPFYKLLNYWMDMLYAVKQIHANGIIHSDLKPANFLEVQGYLKLIDFGIATTIQSDMTSVIKAVPEGSFNYISPEALFNDSSSNEKSPSFGKPKYKISYKSDVWSLGCILYQLVYRRTPFQHITQVWVKLATIVDPNHKIEYPSADWVPQKIIKTIKDCLQINMKLRPSVDELISEYEKLSHFEII